MVIVPPIFGASVGGWDWAHAGALTTWLVGYFCFYTLSRLIKGRGRARFRLPALVYSVATFMAAMFTLTQLGWSVWYWALPFLPFLALASAYTFTGRERAVLARAATIGASMLMMPFMYDIARFSQAAQTSHIPQGQNPTWSAFYGLKPAFEAILTAMSSSPQPLAPGTQAWMWAWVWLVAGAWGAYFFSTVPYIKTLLRARGKKGMYVFSLAIHLFFALVAGVGVYLAFFSWLLGALWLALVVKASLLPLLITRRGVKINIKKLGRAEVLFSLIYLFALCL